MKINYTLDSNGYIVSWLKYPFDEKKPSIEVPDDTVITLGIDKIVSGKIVHDYELEHQKQEIARINLQILELKKQLSDTDYQAIKFAEGELTEEEFAPIKAQRHFWRSEIKRLEALLGN